MAKFKRVSDFEARQVEAKVASGTLALKPGDVIDVDPSTNIATKITTVAGALSAIKDAHPLYLLAQSDAVTEKTGTAYKSYKIDETITLGVTPKIVVGYAIDDITNVEGLE